MTAMTAMLEDQLDAAGLASDRSRPAVTDIPGGAYIAEVGGDPVVVMGVAAAGGAAFSPRPAGRRPV